MLSFNLYVEDAAQELFIRALVSRICRDNGLSIEVKPIISRGGRGRVLTALRQLLVRQQGLTPLPDVILVGNDGNCIGHVARHREVTEIIPERIRELTVCAIPDPHIEKWMFSDMEAFRNVIGPCDELPAQKCERGFYKQALSNAVTASHDVATLGGIEFAEDVVNAMDMNRAMANDASLAKFIRDIRSKLHRYI